MLSTTSSGGMPDLNLKTGMKSLLYIVIGIYPKREDSTLSANEEHAEIPACS
jgi:hypothetical protein